MTHDKAMPAGRWLEEGEGLAPNPRPVARYVRKCLTYTSPYGTPKAPPGPPPGVVQFFIVRSPDEDVEP